MKSIISSVAVSAAALLSAAAFAGDGNSKVSVGATVADLEGATLGLLTARYNYSFTDYVAAEAELGFGVADDELSALGVEADVSAKFNYGLFGVLQYPYDERGSNVFVRAGYMSTELEFEFDGLSDVDVDADGAAIGIGTNYFINDRSGVRFDYTYFDAEIDDNGVESDGEVHLYGISYVHKF